MKALRFSARTLQTVGVFLLGTSLAGCSLVSSVFGGPATSVPQVTPAEQLSVSEVPEVPDMVAATRALGLSFLAEAGDETVVTSPASAVIALAMLGSGASGEAEDQFTEILGVSGEARDRAANALIGSLAPFTGELEHLDLEDPPYDPQVHLASQVVVTDDVEVEGPYAESLRNWFGAEVVRTDLSSDKGKKLLDQWVRDNTAGMIKESAIEPSPALRLVLQNAILFAAEWSSTFDADNTRERSFYLASGEEVTADFLTGTKNVRYASDNDWQMLELPYGPERQLVALYVLPPEGVAPSSATVEQLASLEAALEHFEVDIFIPKVDLSSSFDVANALRQEGFTAVFTANPPSLSYISAGEDLAVSAITQQGRIRIDEEGTVAAAVTEIDLASESAPPEITVQFLADRPHLVFLTDTATGWDLFQVLLNDPLAG